MNKLINNHFNLFITILVSTILGAGIWYVTLFSKLKTQNKRLTKNVSSEKEKAARADKLFKGLETVKREWSEYNLDFESQISKIPDISDQSRIFNVIFDIIKKSEIKVIGWSPSKFPVEEKTIFITIK